MANQLQDRQLQINTLHSEISACWVCRSSVIDIKKPSSMSRGGAGAIVMAIGIAPGASAIKAGKAFAGNSMARFLVWLKAAGYPMTEAQCRQHIYFTSLNKCGASPDSAGNRKNLWSQCSKFLWRQIETIDPQLILLFGKEPAAMILSEVARARPRKTGSVLTSSEMFEGELFPPTATSANWLLLPHPSGLSRAMNDPNTFRSVVEALNENLKSIGFSPDEVAK